MFQSIGGGGRTVFDQINGMPLGNLTSQFLANVYLNELDYFIKHKLRVKYYIRYVDDFVILHNSKLQLKIWKALIDDFLKEKLKLELHKDKSKIIPLSRGVDFVGFRNFYYFKLLRRRNVRKIMYKLRQFQKGEVSEEKLRESLNGWMAYAKWANSYKLRRKVVKEIYKTDFASSNIHPLYLDNLYKVNPSQYNNIRYNSPLKKKFITA